MQEITFAYNNYVLPFFQRKSRFLKEEHNTSEKVVTVEEELDGVDIDGIVSLEDLPRLVFMDEECGNLKVVVDC